MVLKMLFIGVSVKDSTLHIDWARSLKRQCSSSWYSSFTWKMVLKRWFVNDTGEPLHVCSGFMGDWAHQVDMLSLIGNGHTWH